MAPDQEDTMGLLDRLFGRDEEPGARSGYAGARGGPSAPATEDELALQRYRYMLRTAPPETIEQAHAEAFAKLTPQQRQQVLRELSEATGERAGGDDPRSLARMATRAELRQPGITERMFGGPAMGGYGGMMAGTIFGSLVAGFVGSMVANAFFDSIGDADPGGDWGDQGGWGDQAAESGGGDFIDGGGDFGGDFGGDI
jgi:hypothetical protein